MKYGTKSKIGINKAAGQTIGKEETLQRNSRFVEDCQIILDNKKES